jgi:hypothetical protein
VDGLSRYAAAGGPTDRASISRSHKTQLAVIISKGTVMNQTEKNKARECCRQAQEQLVDHLDHCDTNARSVSQRHHCYRHAAWQSGRKARRCIKENA